MSRRSRPTLVVRGEPLKKTRSVGFQFPDFPLDFLLDYGANPSEYKLSGLSTAEDDGCDQMGEDRVRTDDGSKELFVMNKETGEDSLSSELADFGGASYHCDEGSYLRLASSVVLEDGDKMTEDSNVDKMGEDSYTSQLCGGDEDSGDLDSEMGGYPDSLHSTDSEQSELEDELDDEETEETEQSEHIKPSHQQMRGDGPEATNIAAGHVEYFPGYSPTGGKLEATQTVRSPNKKLPVPMAANFIKKNYADYDSLQHFSCAPVKMFHVKSITPDNIGRTFQDVRNSILEILSRIKMEGEPIGLLLVILPHNRAFDAKIEEACENLRVVYQCCLPCDIYKPTKQYLKGIARAIKSKVDERDTFIPFVSEGPTIILGADTSCDTVASVGTSVDWQEFRDYKTVVEPNNGLVIQQLGRMICLENEKGFQDNLLQAFTHLKIGSEPSVTFMVVGGKGVPDDTLDFFCTHGYVQGTKAARYRVIHDENNLTLDQLESIIIKLCFRDREAYQNISMVPPAYAAWSQAQKCFRATRSSSVW